jgi:hypothetical protein
MLQIKHLTLKVQSVLDDCDDDISGTFPYWRLKKRIHLGNRLQDLFLQFAIFGCAANKHSFAFVEDTFNEGVRLLPEWCHHDYTYVNAMIDRARMMTGNTII